MINIFDWILLLLIVIITEYFAIKFRDKRYPAGHAWRPYFLVGLNVKIFGAIFITLVYEYYYHGGDTLAYFNHAKVINSSIINHPSTWLKFITNTFNWSDKDVYIYTSSMSPSYYLSTPNFSVCMAAAVLGIFTGTHILPTAALFAVVSFTGVWAMFCLFAEKYSKHVKIVAWAVLYFPSVVVWGSGILKDTLCIFALSWLTYSIFNIIVNRKLTLSLSIIAFLSGAAIFYIKIYIMIAFVPALAFWLLATYSSKIKNSLVRTLVAISVPVISSVGGLFAFQQLTSNIRGYSLDEIVETSATLRSNLYNESVASGGAAYSLGTIDPGISGLLKAAPAAINVTLFRPYLWESGNPIMLLSALEATTLLLLTIYIIARLGFARLVLAIKENPDLQFFLLFTIVFAFATGISTYNFGSLSRYKIPCLPFFGLFLGILYSKIPRKFPQ